MSNHLQTWDATIPGIEESRNFDHARGMASGIAGNIGWNVFDSCSPGVPARELEDNDPIKYVHSQDQAPSMFFYKEGKASGIFKEFNSGRNSSMNGSQYMSMRPETFDQEVGMILPEHYTAEDNLMITLGTQSSRGIHWNINVNTSGEATQSNSLPHLYPDPDPDPDVNLSRISFQTELYYIRSMRLNIWNLRSNIHEARSVLREKQEIKSKSDDQYTRRLNEHEFGAGSSFNMNKI